MTAEPKKIGAPKGTKGSLKNGSGIRRNRLVVGELPKPMQSVKREARAYRRLLEQAVLDSKGEIDLTDAHIISAADQCTMAAGICRWLLRNRYKSMTVNDIRACNKEMRDALRDRARICKDLDLRRAPPELDLKTYVAEIEDLR